MDILISVVITTYKREADVLKQAVLSVISQTYQHIETIVIDDNYPDSKYRVDNAKLMAEYPQIRYIKNTKNMGVQYSRNVGILLSNGQYIAFLDDDDLWFPKKLEMQIGLFSNDIGMVYCGGYNFYNNNVNDYSHYYNEDYFSRSITFKEMITKGDYIGSTSQALIRKECFARCGMFDCDFKARQDYEMWLRISKAYKIVPVKEPLFYYREHCGERVSAQDSNLLNGYHGLLKKYRDDYNKNKEAKARIYIKIAGLYLNKKLAKAIVYFCRACILSPAVALERSWARVQEMLIRAKPEQKSVNG